VPRARPLAILLVHALVLWALSALALALLARALPVQRALVVHAIGTPILTAVVMAVFFTAFGGVSPLPAALLVTVMVAGLDVATAPWLRRATTPFQEALETWAPWALVFAQALASGIVARRKERSEAAPEAGPPVERAGPADLGAVRTLLAECGLPAADVVEGGPMIWLVRDGEGLAACVGLEPHGEAGLLRSLAVAPRHRGRGLSLPLCRTAAAEADALGVRDLFLLTTTAEPLFARWGFRRIERAEVPPAILGSREFASLCPASAVCMTRRTA
jgi:amino-acid N-acetyltransferase